MRKFSGRHIAFFFLSLLLLAFVAGCSSKGVHMPKHRKRRHCDCPTFSQAAPLPSDDLASAAAPFTGSNCI